MRTLGNILWFILGGALMGFAWWLASITALLTIMGITWAKACFIIGKFSFSPFGKKAVARNEVSQKEDVGTGVLGIFGNVIWFVLAGWWLAIGHLISSLACFITIIGIPFGLQHLKLAELAVLPIGKTIVPIER
ncbi:MAG: uncharacterized membrane protein YccF (DUF307 family) [Methylophilaceae bacterium]|jgi:uncharacterized membrane protein YccF (DUF307 family)